MFLYTDSLIHLHGRMVQTGIKYQRSWFKSRDINIRPPQTGRHSDQGFGTRPFLNITASMKSSRVGQCGISLLGNEEVSLHVLAQSAGLIIASPEIFPLSKKPV